MKDLAKQPGVEDAEENDKNLTDMPEDNQKAENQPSEGFDPKKNVMAPVYAPPRF